MKQILPAIPNASLSVGSQELVDATLAASADMVLLPKDMIRHAINALELNTDRNSQHIAIKLGEALIMWGKKC